MFTPNDDTQVIEMNRPETIENTILELVNRRAAGSTICPSEVARALTGDDWRDLMNSVTDAAWRLEASGLVIILKRGRPVSRKSTRGPVRIGLPRKVGRTNTVRK